MHDIIVTGHGILGLMEVLVEIWVFTFFESLICLKYTGKILDMLCKISRSYERFNDVAFCEILCKISQSYERFNDVAFYEIFGRVYYTCSHKYNIQCTCVTLCLSVESFCCNL